MSNLHGKVALVTGGRGALGSIVAQRFFSEGSTVFSTERPHQRESAPVNNAEEIIFVRADVTSENDVIRLFDEIIHRSGHIDIVVNTVGGFLPGNPISNVSLTEWDTMMSLNLKSSFLCTREALRRMKDRSYGRIINISAMTGLHPQAGTSAYAISKAGVALLTEIAAKESKGSGITANAIAPSIITTPANIAAMPDQDRRGWVTAEEIADSIFYLCADTSRSITGTIIKAFGGR